LVTEVDREAERQLVSAIRTARPDDAILGEEGIDIIGNSGICWLLDPLDGTTNFVHGYQAYAVSVGVEIDGKACSALSTTPLMIACTRASCGLKRGAITSRLRWVQSLTSHGPWSAQGFFPMPRCVGCRQRCSGAFCPLSGIYAAVAARHSISVASLPEHWTAFTRVDSVASIWQLGRRLPWRRELTQQQGRCRACGSRLKMGDMLEVDCILAGARGGRDEATAWRCCTGIAPWRKRRKSVAGARAKRYTGEKLCGAKMVRTFLQPRRGERSPGLL